MYERGFKFRKQLRRLLGSSHDSIVFYIIYVLVPLGTLSVACALL